MMECQQTRELLPWFANGSLDPEETAAVSGHISDCEECRRELAETGAAFEIFGQHLPAEALVELAFEGRTTAVAPELIESHLASCSACSEQLELVRASRESLSTAEAEIEVANRPVPIGETGTRSGSEISNATLRWRQLAMAASLTAMIAVGGWIWSSQQIGAPGAQFRGDDPIDAAVDAGGDGPSLRERLSGVSGPRLNVAVVEVVPTAEGDGPAATLPANAPDVILVLRSSLTGGDGPTCSLLTEDGRVIWTRSGFDPRAEGGFTLAISTEALEPGRYTLTLSSSEGELESYALSVAGTG